MDNRRTIRRALISVYDKDLILDIANQLVRIGAEILSTGGTRDYLTSNNIPVTPVEDLTGFPSIFGGRVKTLHPAVMGGILKRRENDTDNLEGEKYNIPNIDLVIVDLYPFEETVAKGATPEEIIEKIKSFCPNLFEELGYKPWSEEVTARVQAWIDVVLAGNEPTAVGSVPSVAAEIAAAPIADAITPAVTPTTSTVSAATGDDDDLPF